jgi:MFS family permease
MASTTSTVAKEPIPSTSFMTSAKDYTIPESSLDDATPPDPAEAAFKPSSLGFWLIIISVYLAFFLIALDRMIIATAIPSITNTFDSITDIGWYGSAYMLTCAIFNPLMGSVYRLYPIKWVFMTSVIIFEAGSALCGSAPTSIALIIGRAVAGIGAAGISSGSVMIVVNLVPLHKRPVFTSFFGLAFGVSSVLGPIAGGAFADSARLTWRWSFYLNLPIGFFTLLVVFFFLHLPTTPAREKVPILTQIKRLDPLGVLFFAPSMVCLILALQWGGTTYAWSAPRIIALLVVFAVTFVAFIIVEFIMPDTAMAPPRILLQRSVGASLFFTFMSSAGMMTAVYYLSIWFQVAQGQSAMQSGIRTIPMVLSIVLFGIVCAVFTQKIGYYVPALLLSPILASTGAGLLSTLTPTSERSMWIGFQVLYGAGMGAGAQTANLAAQTCLRREDVAQGTALGFFMQQLGGAAFLAVGQNLFSSELVKSLSGIAGLDTQTIINTGATDLKRVVSPDILGTVVNAYSHALTRVFVLSAALAAATMLGAVCLEWKDIRKGKGAAAKAMKADAEKGGPKTEEGEKL